MPFDSAPLRKQFDRYPTDHVAMVMAGWKPLEYSCRTDGKRRLISMMTVLLHRLICIDRSADAAGRRQTHRQ